MRFVIIFLLSLCHLVTKAHDHACETKSSRAFGYVHFTNKNEHDTYILSEDLSDQNELDIDIDEDDNDTVSARKYTLLIKHAIIQRYLQLFSGVYQKAFSNQFSYSRSLIIPTDRYITQRVLRI